MQDERQEVLCVLERYRLAQITLNEKPGRMKAHIVPPNFLSKCILKGGFWNIET